VWRFGVFGPKLGYGLWAGSADRHRVVIVSTSLYPVLPGVKAWHKREKYSCNRKGLGKTRA
jgi:hypothetical protein